jgi:signal transduction histidine kinase
MKKIGIGIGVGGHAAGGPLEQGRAAASAALEQVGQLPAALALVAAREIRQADEILRGVREILGDCPLIGVVSASGSSSAGSVPPEGVRVLLLASPCLRAKVGVGEAGEGGAEQQVRDAFMNSFVTAAVTDLPEDEAERNLYHWYLYRRPSLALAVVISPPGEGSAHGLRIAASIRRRLHGRVPLLMLSLFSTEGKNAVLAGGRVLAGGVALAMIKTDLKFSLERFHSFEPVGTKLFVTGAAGDRILECNGRPAFPAYCESLGLDPAVMTSTDLAPFSLFPLAHRGRDGRFNLLLPDEVGPDGSMRFPATVEPDRVLYPMKAVSATDFWRASARHEALLPDAHALAAAVFMRDTGLRDLSEVLPGLHGGEDAAQPVEIPCGRELKAFLSSADTGGEAGHLLLTFERELDPVAVAAAENERLLREVVELKDLQQEIFDGIEHGIAVVDATRHIRFCNGPYRVLLAGSPASLEGRTCPWSVDGTAVCGTCACEEAIAQCAPVSREVVRVEEGKTHWYRLDTFPLRDGEGNVTAAIEVMRDVTAFKDLRFSLESEQRKIEAVIRGMGETLYIVNARYGLQFFHRGTFPVAPDFERNAHERRCYEALFGRDLPCPWCRMPETALSGSVERRVASVTDAAGEERAYQVTFSPLGSGQGEHASVVCLLVDISAQKRLEQQMVVSEKLNSLSILSAGMAHELNNPLGAINFNLEILKRREKDEEYRGLLDSIGKDVLRINRIVGNLLSFSRSGAASSGWVALPEVIDTTLEIFQVVIERRGIAVRRSYAEGLTPVWGNPQDLQQVFINLIANAVDAMPSGGAIDIAVEVDAQVSTGAEPARVAVVYDNAGELACLGALMDVPGWEVRFFRGDAEAIDAFRLRAATPPEVLLLDFADTAKDRVDFFVMMVKEVAPEARILAVADPGTGARQWEGVPGVASILERPLDTAKVIERMREIVDGLRAHRARRAETVVRFGDSGAGIPPEILARIFDPFFTTKEHKGTGLGLSVVHKILENHGASVRVTSSPGKGTCFEMRFQQTQAAAPGAALRLRQGNGFGRAAT